MRDNTEFMHKAPRCIAMTKDGRPCPNPARRGMFNCHKHPITEKQLQQYLSDCLDIGIDFGVSPSGALRIAKRWSV